MKPSIPKGTRDFSSLEIAKRNFIFSTIKKVFEKYGYQPIETPAIENLETLTGKYGDEGDKLIFKILNSGNVLERLKIQNSDFQIKDISEKALRYDLTVPFARYVVQHQNEITFPFKRYQIQPVWRADRPQKGRYREFYQCDADVIGSNSLLNEVELVQIMNEVYGLLGISVLIKINNRKILHGIAEIIGEKEKVIDITTGIDKLDKIGVDGVCKELKDKGISDEAIQKLRPLISFQGNESEKLSMLKQLLVDSALGKRGIEELETVFNFINSNMPGSNNCQIDFTLARGLNYYTGCIFEVKANEVQIGSICGGGRYDDLTGIFGLPDVSGVGISFGIDRIYDVMDELKIFDKQEGFKYFSCFTKVLFVHFGEAERNFCVSLASTFRAQNISTEIYPDLVKIKKQFDYANKKQIPFVIIIGTEEMQSGKLSIKNMQTGEQEKLSPEEIIMKLSKV